MAQIQPAEQRVWPASKAIVAVSKDTHKSTITATGGFATTGDGAPAVEAEPEQEHAAAAPTTPKMSEDKAKFTGLSQNSQADQDGSSLTENPDTSLKVDPDSGPTLRVSD